VTKSWLPSRRGEIIQPCPERTASRRGQPAWSSAEVIEPIFEREFVAHFFRIVMVLAIRLRLRCSLGQSRNNETD
jgi:hypothetical protein